ncbi:hypothetical protein LCAZH_2956 [Lacticaseibacillus paracasei]|nr:hypothetical protein LCAZH_2956 [Lacticaseibacillus paracasei]
MQTALKMPKRQASMYMLMYVLFFMNAGGSALKTGRQRNASRMS